MKLTTAILIAMCGMVIFGGMLLRAQQQPNLAAPNIPQSNEVETHASPSYMLGQGKTVWNSARLDFLEGHVKAPASPTRFKVQAEQLYDATYQFIQSTGIVRFSDDRHMEISGLFFDPIDSEGQENGYEFNAWAKPAKSSGESVLSVVLLDKPSGLQETNMPVTAYTAMRKSGGLGVPGIILGVEAQLEGEDSEK